MNAHPTPRDDRSRVASDRVRKGLQRVRCFRPHARAPHRSSRTLCTAMHVMTRVDVVSTKAIAGSHLYRFANDALPASVFENPVAFARGVTNPQKQQAVLGAVWDAAGGRLAGADRQDRHGMSAT